MEDREFKCSTTPSVLPGSRIQARGGWLSEEYTRRFWDIQKSPLIESLLKNVQHFALSDLNVRIVGEDGVGKKLLATLIHAMSCRSNYPFVEYSCEHNHDVRDEGLLFGVHSNHIDEYQVKPGILRQVEGGTLYISNYQNITKSLEVKISRMQEIRSYRKLNGSRDIPLDVRVIMGSRNHRLDLHEAGKPPMDMSARRSPVCINVPPLRERTADIFPLIDFFLNEMNSPGVDPAPLVNAEVLEVFGMYPWPGNVRELRDVVRHSVGVCKNGELRLTDIPEYVQHEASRNTKPWIRSK